MVKTTKEELIQILREWGLRKDRGWQTSAYDIYKESWGRYPTLVELHKEDEATDRFLRQIFGGDADLSVHQADAFLRKFMQEATVLDGRYAYLKQLQDARSDAGMGSGRPFAEIHYNVVCRAIGIDVRLQCFRGGRTVLACEYYNWQTHQFEDIYMARFCNHQFVDNGSRMCLHRSKCTRCGHTIEVDSSD